MEEAIKGVRLNEIKEFAGVSVCRHTDVSFVP